MKMKTIKQTVNFRASPHDVYEALMDEKKHAQFTESRASISRKVSGKISAYDDYIEGRNVQLVSDRKIVQEWRCSDWPEKHLSKATFLIAKTKTGSRLIFTQTGVPDNQYSTISKGWKEHYWSKMKKMLEK